MPGGGRIVGEAPRTFDLAQRSQRGRFDQSGFPGGDRAQRNQAAAAGVGGLLRRFDRDPIFMGSHAFVGHRRAMDVVVNGAPVVNVSTDS
jgi:hypothetical protein